MKSFIKKTYNTKTRLFFDNNIKLLPFLKFIFSFSILIIYIAFISTIEKTFSIKYIFYSLIISLLYSSFSTIYLNKKFRNNNIINYSIITIEILLL